MRLEQARGGASMPGTQIPNRRYRIAATIGAIAIALQPCVADDLLPQRVEQPLGPDGIAVARYSDKTLTVAVSVDRDGSRVVAFTEKSRPFVRPLQTVAPRAHDDGEEVQIELCLLDSAGGRYTARRDIGPLCLAHGPDAEPHVAGDTIRLHQDTVLVELPSLDGWSRLELAYYEVGQGSVLRRELGISELGADKWQPSPPGPRSSFSSAEPAGDDSPAQPRAAALLWPEDFGDPDIFRVYGDPAETATRVNVVIVPDGYTYAEKGVMESHAQAMVDHFGTVTPYQEHDPFINYTLVYAYSQESGADQCDCGLVRNTAMGTRFPEAVPDCGNSSNRCLYYGAGCDTNGSTNIAMTELRAPAQDETIVMVNTTRYGGCGGARSVYSAANSSATDIAVHELGHSWAGLADEYAYNEGCGSNAGGINTSTDPVDGAWSEWIADIGAPREGAQYYQSCVYRPETDCEMRALFNPFCSVCKQHWSLVTFGHPRVAPTAPVKSMSPPAQTTAWVGVPQEFSVETRFSVGPQVVNEIDWLLYAPGSVLPVSAGSGSPSHIQSFSSAGSWQLTTRVVADKNFVKPSQYGANRDIVSWSVEVAELIAPTEVSAPGSVEPLLFESPSQLLWEDASAAAALGYNLYRGDLDGLEIGSYGGCEQPDIGQNVTTVTGEPLLGSGWFYLVTAVNPLGEGPLGSSSSGAPRPNVTPCTP